MERTSGVGNNTISINTINSLGSKINLMSHFTVAVIEYGLSSLEVTFHLFSPKLLTMFYQPRHKTYTTVPNKTCLGFPWPSN